MSEMSDYDKGYMDGRNDEAALDEHHKATRERIRAAVQPRDEETLADAVDRIVIENVQFRRDIFGEHAQAVVRFLRNWEALPPLVRASTADNMVRWAISGETTPWYPVSENEQELIQSEMPRRARVHAAFREASRVLRGLATALVRVADAKAEAAGIDADTGKTP